MIPVTLSRTKYVRQELPKCTACGAGFKKNRANHVYCRACVSLSIERERQLTNSVKYAVKTGRLAKLDGSIPCVDCSEPATAYDHRDWQKPLEVEPVCRSCNFLRGPAKNLVCT